MLLIDVRLQPHQRLWRHPRSSRPGGAGFQQRPRLEHLARFADRRLADERITPEALVRLQSHIDQEHLALGAGDPGRALRLSGLFHVEIARIADKDTIAAFITQLVARSSLIIALYWQRRNALCESHAHHALLQALADHDGDRADDLMKGHLLDLVSSLDLRNLPTAPQSLREALVRP